MISGVLTFKEALALVYTRGTLMEEAYIEMEPSGVLSKIAEAGFPKATVIALEGGDTDTAVWRWKSWTEDNETRD